MGFLPEGVDKVLSTKVVEKAYEDILSETGKEAGKLGVDIVKTARLVLFPLQITAAFQGRLEKLIKRIADRVPEEKRITVPAEIIGPALEKMKYLDEDALLWQMFEELLTRSVNKEDVSRVHPAFVQIISLLSRDEAVILYKLHEKDFEIIDTLDLNASANRFENLKIEKSDVPTGDLVLSDKVNLYYSHLESLSLVSWPVYKQDPIKDAQGRQVGVRRYSKMHLTEFGMFFVSVCIPPKGFTNL